MPVPLHVHSWYSLLEGASSPERMLERAAACGYKALALTDTNNLYGAVPFIDSAQQYGIRPLLGACLRQHRSRCVALVAEPAGYRSLCRVLSRLHLEGCAKAKKGSDPLKSRGQTPFSESAATPPRLADLLSENADGLHALVDDVVMAERLREAFGPRLWVEVVRPARSNPEQEQLLALGRRLGLQPIASTAVHFAAAAEYQAFRLITAVSRTTLLDRLPRRLGIMPEHYLVDPEELRRRFRDLPEAVRNTDVLAEQLRSDVLPHEVILPPARVPRHVEATQYLHHLCERGLRRRGLGSDLAARQRLREELAVIEAGALAGYFLVVRDIARYARRQGYGMALRGSAGNSLVCFLLEITDVDPLRFHLPLERFLHPGRADLPDIDLDFDWKVRDDVIAHVFQRHPPGHTAMISSHLFLQPRSAFREAAKVHGLANEQISRLLETLSERVEAGAWWGESGVRSQESGVRSQESGVRSQESGVRGQESGVRGQGSGVRSQESGVRSQESGAFGASAVFSGHALLLPDLPPGFPLEPERWPQILEDARLLLGRPHHLSIHPGGVVITPRPVEDFVPLQRAPKGIIITQFEKDAAERIGLVKIDLLGNRALSTVDEALRRQSGMAVPSPASVAGSRRRVAVAPSRVATSHPIDRDPPTVALLQHGDTLGVNQLESPAMRHLLVQMRPERLEDVIQALAAIRPGAAFRGRKNLFIRRRRGVEPVHYAHPSLEPVLRDTLGIILYEDDILHVAQALTGWPAPVADRFRKRLTRYRTEEEGKALEAEFLEACTRHGVSRAAAAEQWSHLALCNHYAFCKSHAVSYGLIAWRAAYLKVHDPVCFWTAALNNNQGMYPRRVYVEAIKRSGIDLRLPCVNRSTGPFTVEGDAIRTGLDAIASLGAELRTVLLTERERAGPYRDLADFRHRVAPGSEALAALIRCGALDFTGLPRPALFLEAELQDHDNGNADRLFQDDPLLAWSPSNYGAERRLRDEWHLLGFVVGPSLFSLCRPRLPSHLVTSRQLPDFLGKRIQVAGMVAAWSHAPTADGREIQFVTLEDEWGLIEVTLFPGTCPSVAYLTLGPYLATGVVEEQFGVITLTADSFRIFRT